MKADFNEIYRLYARRLYLYIYGKGEYLYGCVDYEKALPKVKDILNKYDLVTLDFEAMPPQVIETANCTFIFGRTDGILKYNSNEFDADSFVIKRENGEEITVEKGHVDSELWKVADLDNMSWFPETSSDGNGNLVARYNYGFILGADEKVSVIINGKTYK